MKLRTRAIDEQLRRDAMQCCVHGDTKDYNIFFSNNNNGNVAISMYNFPYYGWLY